MPSEAALNVVQNYCEKVSAESVSTFEKYTTDKHKKSMDIFIKKSKTIDNKAALEIAIPNKKYTKNDVIKKDDVLTKSVIELNELKENVSNMHLADIKAFFDALLKNIGKMITKFVTQLISKIGTLISGTITQIQNMATDFINSISAKLTLIYNNAITAFNTTISALSGKAIIAINSIKNSYKNLTTLFSTKPKDIKENFFKRAKGQASVSKLAQVNVKNKAGTLKENVSVLKDTPAQKILLPKVKFDINKVLTFEQDPISKLLGYTSSLIPTIQTKKIAEPKPTDDKAEYGKIQVKENKAGFQEISDETPGNVRKVSMHPTGTYTSMIDNGDYTTKVTGNKIDINENDWNIKTDKDKVEIIVGDCKMEIRKNYIQSISGKMDSKVEGDNNLVVEGDVSDDFKSNYAGKIEGDYSENVDGDKTEKTGGDLTEKISGSHKETVTGSFTLTVIGNVNIVSSGSTNITSSGSTNIQSSSKVSIKAPLVEIGGGIVKLG